MNKLLIIFLILIAVGCAENDILPNDPAGRAQVSCWYNKTWILGCNDMVRTNVGYDQHNWTLHIKPTQTQSATTSTIIQLGVVVPVGSTMSPIQFRLGNSGTWTTVNPGNTGAFYISVPMSYTCPMVIDDPVFDIQIKRTTCNATVFNWYYDIRLFSATNGHSVMSDYCIPSFYHYYGAGCNVAY